MIEDSRRGAEENSQNSSTASSKDALEVVEEEDRTLEDMEEENRIQRASDVRGRKAGPPRSDRDLTTFCTHTQSSNVLSKAGMVGRGVSASEQEKGVMRRANRGHR